MKIKQGNERCGIEDNVRVAAWGKHELGEILVVFF